VTQVGCTLDTDGVEVRSAGDYNQFQCGIQVTAQPKHRGVWICELERYHAGFSRRYGEVRYGQVSVSVTKNTNLDYTTLTSTNKTTTTEISTTTTTTTTTENGYFNYPIKRPFAIHRTKEEEEIYQRNFLILKVIVRVTVVLLPK